MLVSIDPGVKDCGVALWDDNELAAAWLARGRAWDETSLIVKETLAQRVEGQVLRGGIVAIERPKVYHQSKQRGDQRDIISLAIFVGSVATRLLSLGLQPVFYEPSAWKGSVPKDVMVERIKKKLSAEEHARVDLPSPSLRHNVWDAVGIGLYHLKRR